MHISTSSDRRHRLVDSGWGMAGASWRRALLAACCCFTFTTAGARCSTHRLLPRWQPAVVCRATAPLISTGTARKKPQKNVLPKRAWQVGVSGMVCAAVLNQVASSRPPRLFALHVLSMAPMLPLGTAGISTVRQRLSPPAVKLPNAAAKKRRSEWLVIRHFIASAAALYVASLGLFAIWLHKEALGRAHLTTPHALLGAAAWALWLGAYLAAQPHVWRDQLKARKFSLLTNKRWLWSSPSHRQIGIVAYVFSMLAYASGMLGWRALHRGVSTSACVAVGAVGTTVVGKHGIKDVGGAVRLAVGRPWRSWKKRRQQHRLLAHVHQARDHHDEDMKKGSSSSSEGTAEKGEKAFDGTSEVVEHVGEE